MTTRETLFTGAEAPVPAEAANGGEFGRSPLEGYVLGEMPTDLRAVSEGQMTYEELAEKHNAILEEMAPHIDNNTDRHTAEMTHMDLMFMFGSYIPAGEDMYRKAPPSLMSLMQQHGDQHQLEPFMTYEQIVDLNSAEYLRTGNMRVYADGEAGVAERDFYLGHHLAEPHAKRAAYKLHQLVEQPHLVDATALLSSAREDLDEFKRYMGRYAGLSKEHFAYFRQYLGSYADGTRNASGAFMPSVQLLELAMLDPTEQYDVYMEESMRYFPRWSQSVMHEWRAQSGYGANVESMVDRGQLELDDEATKELIGVVDEFINFRMAHLGITKAQIPEAFSSLEQLTRRHIGAQDGEKQIMDPKYRGTAGFDVRNVLTNSAFRLLKFRERLVGSAEEEAA